LGGFAPHAGNVTSIVSASRTGLACCVRTAGVGAPEKVAMLAIALARNSRGDGIVPSDAIAAYGAFIRSSCVHLSRG
jgi:hypothetical protein